MINKKCTWCESLNLKLSSIEFKHNSKTGNDEIHVVGWCCICESPWLSIFIAKQISEDKDVRSS